MRRHSWFLVSLLLICSVATAEGADQRSGLVVPEQVFDFGHVGIDFKLYHTYLVVNEGDDTVRIVDLNISCDCSSVAATDSVLGPGDTVFFPLRFHTRDLFGPTTKSFVVYFDDPLMPELKFYYLSTIGQWYDYLKPDPISLFFLPGQTEKIVKIPNRVFDRLSLKLADQSDTTFDLALVSDEATKGESLTVSVRPKQSLPSGTHMASLTLELDTHLGKKPVLLSIPVKTVRY